MLHYCVHLSDNERTSCHTRDVYVIWNIYSQLKICFLQLQTASVCHISRGTEMWFWKLAHLGELFGRK